jgi:two-component sensor histidine kinase
LANRYATHIMRLRRNEKTDFGTRIDSINRVQIFKDNKIVPPNELPLRRAMHGDHFENEEYTFRFMDGTECVVLVGAVSLRDENGKVIGAVSAGLDITDRKRQEANRQLLVHELNHRVKNTLATVQSIVHQTMRRGEDPKLALDKLNARLIALSKTHDVLTQENWKGAELRDLAMLIVDLHGGAERFVVEGPAVYLAPATAMSLSLALHELATNAIKYGSLSSAGGKVRLAWSLIDGDTGRELVLTWTENGGPPVDAPEHEGFGLRLIRNLDTQLSTRTILEFQETGLTCVIRAHIDPPRPAGSPATTA